MKKIVLGGILLSIVALISLALILSLSNKVVSAENIFSELPAKPDNLDIVKREITLGSISNLCVLGEEYYLQPEFYPTWKLNEDSYYSHDYTRWGVYGYGTYPSEQGVEVTNFKKGEEITFCTYFKTSYGIETWQGIKLIGAGNEYFDVYVDPSMFVTPPTFPQFSREWARKITVKFIAKEDIPVGNYVLGFRVDSPPDWFKEQMTWKIIEQEANEEYVEKCSGSLKSEKCQELYNQRKLRYVQGGTWNIGDLLFKVKLNVR